MENNKQSRILLAHIICALYDTLKKLSVIFLIMGICAAGFDIYRSITVVPSYRSTLTAQLGASQNDYKSLEKVEQYIPTLNYVLNSRTCRQYVAKKMKTGSMNGNVNVSIIEGKSIRLSVTSHTKKEAYYSIDYVTQWYKKNRKKYNFPYSITSIENQPFSQKPVTIYKHTDSLIKGALYSGIIATGLYFLYYFLKQTLKSHEEIDELVSTRLYARIPRERKPRKLFRRNKQPILITSLKTSFAYKEAINKLRSRVERSAKKHGYKVFMVTSTLENEGKSSCTVNLALALAKNGNNVLLIDGDIRKPSVDLIFGQKTDKSFNKYYDGETDWDEQVIHLEKQNLYVLLAEADLKRAEEMVSSEKFKKAIEEAREEFDFIIVDTSPCRNLNEPMIIDEYVDASLFVIKQNNAKIEYINETIQRLQAVKGNLIGAIYVSSINAGNITSRIGYGYGRYGNRYGYNRYYGYNKEKGSS